MKNLAGNLIRMGDFKDAYHLGVLISKFQIGPRRTIVYYFRCTESNNYNLLRMLLVHLAGIISTYF